MLETVRNRHIQVEIRAGMLKYGYTMQTAAKRCAMCEKTFRSKLNNPNTMTLAELRLMQTVFHVDLKEYI